MRLRTVSESLSINEDGGDDGIFVLTFIGDGDEGERGIKYAYKGELDENKFKAMKQDVETEGLENLFPDSFDEAGPVVQTLEDELDYLEHDEDEIIETLETSEFMKVLSDYL